jgi:RNase P/RNase MRP subunit POP5
MSSDTPTPTTHQPLTIHRITHPVTTYFTSQITFAASSSSAFKCDIGSISALINSAIVKLYGFIGSVTIKYEVVQTDPTDLTFTVSVDDVYYNSLRAALTYYTSHQNTPISINTIVQGSTLDACMVNKAGNMWFDDILYAE